MDVVSVLLNTAPKQLFRVGLCSNPSVVGTRYPNYGLWPVESNWSKSIINKSPLEVLRGFQKVHYTGTAGTSVPNLKSWISEGEMVDSKNTCPPWGSFSFHGVSLLLS